VWNRAAGNPKPPAHSAVTAASLSTGTDAVVDPADIFRPATYAHGVPCKLLATLRRTAPVCCVGEPSVGEWAAGSGYWAVFRHTDIKYVLRNPELFSSHVGAPQIRDPDTPADLAFVQDMMLNQDPPQHGRLRRIVAAAFTPRAVRAPGFTKPRPSTRQGPGRTLPQDSKLTRKDSNSRPGTEVYA
jgi:cytochrome P450